MEAVPCCKRQTRKCFLHESQLEEILIRLPIKSIFRFKSVSKQWFSLLSGPSFVHRKITAFSSSLPWTILYRPSSKYGNPEHLIFKSIVSLDFTSPGFSILSAYPDDPKTVYMIVSMCSKSGLLLLLELSRLHTQSIYHLCNPITSQWVTLPPLKRKIWGRESIVTQVDDDRGCLTRFKVVILDLHNPTLDTPGVSPNALVLDIFSSETKGWMSIQVHCPQRVIDLNEVILFNGILHYFTNKYDSPAILAYDPYTDSKDFRLIEYPRNGKIIQDLCCVSQGRLLYLCHDLDKKKVLKSGYSKMEGSGVWNTSYKRPYSEDSILYVFPPWPMSIPLLSTDAIVNS